MTQVAILRQSSDDGASAFRAVAGDKQSVGRTEGEALDALVKQLPQGEAGTIVIVRALRPDRFFTEEQRRRLSDLMGRWRAARDSGGQPLSPTEQSELDALVDAELRGSANRTAALLAELGLGPRP